MALSWPRPRREERRPPRPSAGITIGWTVTWEGPESEGRSRFLNDSSRALAFAQRGDIGYNIVSDPAATAGAWAMHQMSRGAAVKIDPVIDPL